MLLSIIRLPRWSSLACALGLGVVAALAAPARAARAQAAPPVEAPDSVIEWNFRPVSPGADVASLEERWAAPFAVESRGRPAPRTPRPVVVLRDSVAARRVAAAQAAAGESAAEVSVAPGAAPAAAAAASSGGGGATASASAGASDAGGGGASAARPSPTRTAPAAGGSSASAGRAAATRETPRTHRVEYGETWYGIVREYRVSSARLAAANPDVDPERLRSGTVLRIPAAAAAADATRTHTVARGDTLFGIARRYGVSAAAIRSANRLTDDVVRLGQTLVIPR